MLNSSNGDDGSYYSHLLGRVVKKPTPVLYNMIKEIRNETKKVEEELLEERICERCKTYPDDVNWVDPYHKVSPFFYLCASNEINSMILKYVMP